MKKIIAIFALSFVLVNALTACSGKDDTATEESEE
jgi:hypothetical protein